LVRREAVVCRFCGGDIEPAPAARNAAVKVAALGVSLCLLAAAVGYVAIPLLNQSSKAELSVRESDEPLTASTGEVTQGDLPGARRISVGETIEWEAASAADVEHFSLGDYALTIEKIRDDGSYLPRMTFRAFGQTLVLDGSATSETMPHQFSLVRMTSSQDLSVVFQSFSGGAHCCNHLQIAQIVRGKLVAVDLGSMDGDYIAVPKDLDGDGVVDFEFSDNAFLYAFAPYAMSYTPSRFVNVIEGKAADVSGRKAFRRRDILRLPELAKVCRNDPDGNVRNGACAAFVAVASRVGRLNEAWPIMVASYDASVDWEFPVGCQVSMGRNGCPEHQQVTYQSYPDALLSFLKEHGYISRTWLPPEAFAAPPNSTEIDYSDTTAI
jgi:hypothetical protein